MNKLSQYYQSSIGRKQIVATTGLMLILFLIGHLAGNLLILGGPELYNGYAHKLASLRPGLYVVEVALGFVFLIHIFVTYTLVAENIMARGKTYRVLPQKGERSLATQLMPYTGTIILAFLMFHLLDFTFANHEGMRSILRDGKSYGLYGVVYNSFSDPLHSALYIIAMVCVGFHLCHAVESFCQTFGLTKSKYHYVIKNFSNAFGLLVGWAYSMIPVFVLIKNMVT